MGVPDYLDVIARPMDLGTVRAKLRRRGYGSADAFASDVRLVFNNAKQYNVSKSETQQRRMPKSRYLSPQKERHNLSPLETKNERGSSPKPLLELPSL